MANRNHIKGELIHIMHEFTGFDKRVIKIYGDYVDYGNKQRLICGAFTLVKYGDMISIWYPDYSNFPDEIAYIEEILQYPEEDIEGYESE